MSEVLENDYRRKTCLFIRAAGKALELPVEAIATALVFFHKFFMLHSFQSHERFVIGSACLFVASKVEENPRKVEVVVGKCYCVWKKREPFPENEKPFKRLREKILIGERCVLHTLGFQLSVEHPYSKVMYYLKMLFAQGKGADGGRGTDKALSRQLTQAATSFVNDSLLTTLCLQYRPEQVAAAVVYLSYLYMGLQRVDTTALDTDEDVVAAICDAILSLYDDKGAAHATAAPGNARDQLQKRIGSPVALSKQTPPGASASATASATTASASTPARTPPATSPRPTPSPSPSYNADANQASAPPSLRYSNGDAFSATEQEWVAMGGGRVGDAVVARHADGDPRRRRSTTSASATSQSPASQARGSPKSKRGREGSAPPPAPPPPANGAGVYSGLEASQPGGKSMVDPGAKRAKPL